MIPEEYARLEQLFEAALALGTAERKAFVSALQASEPPLAAELLGLLAADERSESFIDARALDQTPDSLLQRLAGSTAAGSWASGASGSGAASNVRRQLGPYRVLEPLGRGGMGVVYRAEHVESGVQVAVKTLRAVEQGSISSLRREIQALARIRHPGIVRILGEGLEHGLPWYAMELLEGKSLNRFWAESFGSEGKHLARKPELAAPKDRPAASARRIELALRLVHGLCSPLGYLHGEGLVHRDLKPQNILIRAGSPVLIDFGLMSTFTHELSRDALELEALGAGTAAYMAPEQIRGESCDARADQYSLGCIFFELLTGQRPFLGRNTSEVRAAHLFREAVAPSELVEGLPVGLDELVLRLLAKAPGQRLGHADDLAAALERLGVPAPPPETPKGRAYLYWPGFSGRDKELDLLRGRLSLLERGTGGVAFVGGASGIGKTRLGLELAREASLKQVEVLTGESLPPEQQGGGAALGPLRRPLQQLADRCRERGLAEAERIFGARGPLLAAYEPSLSMLPGFEQHPPVAEMPPQESRLRLFRALAEVLESAAGAGAKPASGAQHAPPLLLVLDDLQWADGLTLAFLDFLLRYPPLVEPKPDGPQLRLMLLGQYRTEEVGEPLRALLASPNVLHRQLGRLEPDAVGSMVAQMLALPRPSELFGRFLDRHAEGNPFFVAEYLRTAVAESLLWRDERGDWQIAEPSTLAAGEQDYEALPLPRSLRELVLRRLQGLPEPALRLAEAASAVGRESDALLLRRVLGLDGHELSAWVQELLRRQVLEEPLPGRLRFVHDKLREVAYERIAPEGRPALHRAVAEAIEELFAAEREQRLAELAHHWDQAGERCRAQDAYLRGARREVERSALEEARRLYRAYLQLVEEPTQESTQVRLEFVEKLAQRLGWKAVSSEATLALEEARSLGAEALQSESLRLLSIAHIESGRVDEAQTLLDEALVLARRIGDPHLEALALGRLAIVRRLQGSLEQAQALNEQTLAIARQTGDRALEGSALTNLATNHEHQGHMDEARTLYEEGLELHRKQGDKYKEGILLHNFAGLHYIQGRPQEALTMLQLALDLHRQVGNRRFEAGGLGNLGLIYQHLGRLEEARKVSEQALELHRQVRNRPSEAIVLGDLGRCHFALGQLEAARRRLEQALELHREVGNRRFEGNELGYLAALDRLEGRTQRARKLAEEGEQLLREGGSAIELASSLCSRGHVELAAGASGRPCLEEAQALAAKLGCEPGSGLALDVSKLCRAVEAFEAGEQERLFQGELIEDLPESVRRSLAATGQLTPERARLPEP